MIAVFLSTKNTDALENKHKTKTPGSATRMVNGGCGAAMHGAVGIFQRAVSRVRVKITAHKDRRCRESDRLLSVAWHASSPRAAAHRFGPEGQQGGMYIIAAYAMIALTKQGRL